VKIIEQLVDRGLIRDYADLYRLTLDKMLTLDRMGPKLADNILTAVRSSQKTTLERLIYALGILHVGEHIAKLLTQEFSSVEELSQASSERLTGIKGIGEQIASSIVKFFEQKGNQKVIQKLKEFGVEYPPRPARPKAKELKLKGKSFVFTGGLKSLSRSEAESKVESMGGRASSSVSKKTDFVVAGEEAGSKLEKAKSLGLKILTEEDFLELIQ
jgi:DNA ligase (NAD+)